MENEGFCAEEPSGYNIILILKQHDWFKEVSKFFENKKITEKSAKKLLVNSYQLFNYEFISIYTASERKYFSYIISKGTNLVMEIGKFIEKNTASANSGLSLAKNNSNL